MSHDSSSSSRRATVEEVLDLIGHAAAVLFLLALVGLLVMALVEDVPGRFGDWLGSHVVASAPSSVSNDTPAGPATDSITPAPQLPTGYTACDLLRTTPEVSYPSVMSPDSSNVLSGPETCMYSDKGGDFLSLSIAYGNQSYDMWSEPAKGTTHTPVEGIFLSGVAYDLQASTYTTSLANGTPRYTTLTFCTDEDGRYGTGYCGPDSYVISLIVSASLSNGTLYADPNQFAADAYEQFLEVTGQ